MKHLIIAATIAAIALPAAAQQSKDGATRATEDTMRDLTQAWWSARVALERKIDELAIATATNKALEAKLPRQEPIKGPSGEGNAPKENP